MQRTLKAMSVKNFSDKEPTQIQEFGTRKEIKENEALINKGKQNIRIAVFISVVTLIITVSVWVPIRKHRGEKSSSNEALNGTDDGSSELSGLKKKLKNVEELANQVLKDTQKTIDHANKLEEEFKGLEAKANGNSSDFETRIENAKTDLGLLVTKYDKIHGIYGEMLAATKCGQAGSGITTAWSGSSLPCTSGKKCFCRGHSCLVGSTCSNGVAYANTGGGNFFAVCHDNAHAKRNAEVLCKELGFPVDSTSSGVTVNRGTSSSSATRLQCEGHESSLMGCKKTSNCGEGGRILQVICPTIETLTKT